MTLWCFSKNTLILRRMFSQCRDRQRVAPAGKPRAQQSH